MTTLDRAIEKAIAQSLTPEYKLEQIHRFDRALIVGPVTIARLSDESGWEAYNKITKTRTITKHAPTKYELKNGTIVAR